jgi:hypothetical protein
MQRFYLINVILKIYHVIVNTVQLGGVPAFFVRGKYSAVIGRETRFSVCALYEYAGCGFFIANHSAVFDPVHQTTEFRQTTV